VFFDSWSDLIRVFVVGVLAYAALVAFLRVSGKRTLTKMNAFDLVVTVALGSTLANILLSADVSLSEGLAALALLIGLQFLVAWSAVRAPWVNTLVKSEPRLLFFRGEVLWKAMKAERVTEGELQAAMRASGFVSYDEVESVVLETAGDMSVIGRREDLPRAGGWDARRLDLEEAPTEQER
jgi:uncharacterized membrane protein YcaP (DUF421 family)